MIDHAGIHVTHLARSRAFYSKALAATGHSKVVDLPGTPDGNDPAAGFCHADGSDFWIRQGEVTRPPVHVAFRVPCRADVEAFYEAALAAGGRDNGAPGLRKHYHEHYYSAFVLDPDGHNIEAVCHDAP